VSKPTNAPPASDVTINDPRRRRAVLWAVCLALMAVVASVSGLNVAQPQLAAAFDASQNSVLWMINSYTITLAALLLPLGALGDRIGRKRILLVGIAVFALANVLSALAPTGDLMLLARVLSGVGAAMIMPITLATITSTFPPAERSRAIGIWTAVAGGGGILGMFVSALLVDIADWRYMFVLPIVLAVVSAVIAIRSVPADAPEAAHRFDIAGASTSIVATVGFSYTLQEGPVQGWVAPLTVTALMLGITASIAFVLIELRVKRPLLNVRYFSSRGVSSGSLLLLGLFGVQAGVSIVLYPFFQVVLGWSGLLATVALLPMAVLMMLFSGIAPRVAARIGARATMVTGLLVAAAGLTLMATLVSAEGGFLTVLPGMIGIGIGMGLAMTPSTEAITSSLPKEHQGIASALNDLTREFGAALGVALLGALLTAGYQSAIGPRLANIPTPLAEAAQEGIANAAHAATGPFAQRILDAATAAFVSGWQTTMWVGVAVLAVITVFVVVRGPRASDQLANDH
jgi:EmrB/QacA subfamily drug resistance transporter